MKIATRFARKEEERNIEEIILCGIQRKKETENYNITGFTALLSYVTMVNLLIIFKLTSLRKEVTIESGTRYYFILNFCF